MGRRHPSVAIEEGDIGIRGIGKTAIFNNDNLVGIAFLEEESGELAAVSTFIRIINIVTSDKPQRPYIPPMIRLLAYQPDSFAVVFDMDFPYRIGWPLHR